MPRVLLIGFPHRDASQIQRYFKKVQVDCDAIANLDAALEKIPADPPSLVMAEKPAHIESLVSLKSVLKASAPATPFLVTLYESNVDQAMEAMRAGAFDCLARPFDRFQVLASAKRATLKNGRTLFVAPLTKPRRPFFPILLTVMGILFLSGLIRHQYNGPPPLAQSLGSASLSGIQWNERTLWVGNWLDSTITKYRLKKGFFPKSRILEAETIFKMSDSQPILVCDTPDALVTVGFDLKIRSHQRLVGLPTLQSASTPANNPTGLTWDGKYIWTSDSQTNLLYKHGPDLRVLDTVKSLLPGPLGVAWDGERLWVVGGMPLKAAFLAPLGSSYIWQGPFDLSNVIPEGVEPSGLTAGFGRLWFVSGGDPNLTSRTFKKMLKPVERWLSTGPLKGKLHAG